MSRQTLARVIGTAVVGVVMLSGCEPSGLSRDEKELVASLALTALPPLPDDATNKVANNPAAAAFGATLFFDKRLSRDGLFELPFDRSSVPGRPATGTRRRRHQPPHDASCRNSLEHMVLLGRPTGQPVVASAHTS